MKNFYDKVTENCSKIVTQSYSTSFSLATKMLDSSIRNHIYNIYGFVRFADEIVDTFHGFPKEELLNRFEKDLNFSLEKFFFLVIFFISNFTFFFKILLKKFNFEM